VHDTLLRVDRLLGRLFAHLDALVGRNQYVVALSSDHGVTAPTDEVLKRPDRGFLNVGDIRDRVEQLLQRKWGAGPYVASLQADSGQVYFTAGTYRRLQEDPAVLKDVIAAIASTPGIQRVLRSEEASSGLASSDRILREAALSYFPGRSGDLILIMQPGWISLTGMAANHGLSASPDDQPVPIFLMGPGIKPGEYRDSVTPADIAPTLAALCGVSLPKVEGHVLTSALIKTPSR
jgi:arylsulfatase A-like enzyme